LRWRGGRRFAAIFPSLSPALRWRRSGWWTRWCWPAQEWAQAACQVGRGQYQAPCLDLTALSLRLLRQLYRGLCPLDSILVSAVSLGVPCPLPAPRLTPSPHLQRLPGFIQLCPRAPSCLPPPLSGLEDLDPCHPATLPKTRWTPQPQPEVLRTRGLQGRERPSQFARVLVPPPPPPHLCPPTPWGTTPPPVPWTPTSCNNMNISEAQLISAICMMMEHLHFDCCILSPFWSRSLFGTFALWNYADVESRFNYIIAGTCVFPTSLLQKTPPWSTPIIVSHSHCLVYITRHLRQWHNSYSLCENNLILVSPR